MGAVEAAARRIAGVPGAQGVRVAHDPAEADQRHGVVRLDCRFVGRRLLQDVELEVDADLAQLLLHQLGRLGREAVAVEQLGTERAAVGQIAHAVTVGVHQAQLVQQLVGPVDVVLV